MAKAYHIGYDGGCFDWCLGENRKPKEQQMTLQQLNRGIND